RTYKGSKKDVDLISAYLVSICHFARHLMGEDIQEIKLERHTIVYELQDTIMIAIVTTGRSPSKRKITSLLKRIYRAFLEDYEEHLQQKIVEPEIYRNFRKKVDQIILK
ncbi:MAG: hypothetical protein ACXACR_08795, partial [Candidatus Hodarchaeales archaeon]